MYIKQKLQSIFMLRTENIKLVSGFFSQRITARGTVIYKRIVYESI